MTWATYPYAGSRVVVTGAGSGIGRAIAHAFLDAGAAVTLVGRTRRTLEETAARAPDRARVHVADVSRRDDIDRTIADVADDGIDVVVACAGLSEHGRIEELTDASWERMRSLNLDGTIFLARAAMPHLRRARGSFLAVSSIAGLGGDWSQPGYSASKAGVNALVQAMAMDEGRAGVRVNAIAPGFTRTQQTADRLDDPEFSRALLDRVALDRAAEPGDIAAAALFLASPDAAYITGVVLPVDGGTTASVGTPRPIAHA
ncbi:SDR family NAD(P)-dependent oxidoreductase [Microbacterium excoecariae]|uniref:SDR family NAD(P)-dependent oxidoreductase n=1 Tax=Microbacterium excoecariae TaxID=2715210 RepID=UPI001407AC9A|nr:SDR family oxidoreductase [Microbacterium excoecariae]NHI16280.1 SDR family oxidoreductase [Microbacterium excoecariae]